MLPCLLLAGFLPAPHISAFALTMKSQHALHSRPWLWMVVVALFLRVAVILVFQTYATPDAVWSHAPFEPAIDHFAFGCETGAIAKSLATGNGFSSPFGGRTGPTAWIAPVYPSFCAIVFKLFGVYTSLSAFAILFANSVFSALTCIPLYRIGERTWGTSFGLCAGWIWACGIIFMRWPTTWIWEVSLSALLLSIAFLIALQLEEGSTPKRWIIFGLFWGFSALTNPALLTFLPFSVLWPAYHLFKRHHQWLLPALFTMFTFVVVISPWLVRNRVVFGKWVFIRGNAPFEFSLGNYHGSNGLGWFGKHPTKNKQEWNSYAKLGEVSYVSEKGKGAAQFIRQNPSEFAHITGKRIWAMWHGTYLDYTDERDPWTTWMYWPLSLTTLLGLLAITIRREKAAWLFAAAILVYPLAYYLTFAQPRYRHAIEPLMLLVSSYIFMGLAGDIQNRISRKHIVQQESSHHEPAICS